MTLLEHLAELRSRLFKSALALTIGAAIGYALFPEFLHLILDPYCDLPQALKVTTDAAASGQQPECVLLALRPLDPFSVRIKASLVIGLFLGGPVIFFQVWRFITPGLTKRERRYALPFVVLSQVMFGFGIAFAYFVIPQGLRILLGMGGDAIVPALTASEYLSFFLSTSVAFGVVFELPLLLTFLAMIGMVSAAGLRRFRPYAVVVNVAVAAVVTPTTDAVTLLALAGPMILFYEMSIISAWLIERSRRRRRERT